MPNETKHPKRPLGLTLIAIGKAIKVIVLLAVGTAALALVGKNPPAVLLHWADMLRVDAGNRYLYRILEKLTGATPKKLEELGVGTFLYAALFSIEGTGLWLQKRWAEYFTIAITLSFIPLEIFEIVRHASVGKVVTLILNVAALVYLVVRVVVRRRGERGAHDSPSGFARSSADRRSTMLGRA